MEKSHMQKKQKIEKIDLKQLSDDESFSAKNSKNLELEQKVKKFEEANKLIRETTGADDINEICQKYSNLRETKDKLKKERKDLEKLCEVLTKKKEEMASELSMLKYQGQDDITRKEIEDNEKTAERSLKACEESRQRLKKAEKLINEVRAGISMITTILKSKIFDEIFSEDRNFTEKEKGVKVSYNELIGFGTDKDMRLILNKVIEVSEYLFQRYSYYKENFPIDENEGRLTRKEENELEQIYMHQSVDSIENSISGNEEDDIDKEVLPI